MPVGTEFAFYLAVGGGVLLIAGLMELSSKLSTIIERLDSVESATINILERHPEPPYDPDPEAAMRFYD